MLHDHNTNRSGSKSPTCLPHKVLLLFFIFEFNAKHFGKVLTQIMTGCSLYGTTIFINPSLNCWSTESTWEFFRIGFDAFDDWNSQDFFVGLSIEFQIGVHLLFCFFKCSVSSMSFLPQKFSCSNEGSWMFELPSDYVSPLIQF